MMKVLVFSICFVLTGFKAHTQSSQSSDVLGCFEVLFVTKNFDSKYYLHNDVRSPSFFIVNEGTIGEVSILFEEDKNLFELRNGNLLSINGKGTMGLWGIKYYLRFKRNILTDKDFLILFETIEFDGFTENVLSTREVLFIKRDSWEIFSDKYVDSNGSVK